MKEPWQLAYSTSLGRMFNSSIEDALESGLLDEYRGKVQLLFTSPPFPLNRKKRYGNLTGDEYLRWMSALAPRLVELLKPRGSIVVELGNGWEPRQPTMSVLPLRALLGVLEAGELHLCQQFVCHNPARLPTPAQWVTIERIRVKDAFTHVWWMSPSSRPKANNRRVLTEYSDAMKLLLEKQTYNSGTRPSGHNISDDAFLKDNGGAIPSNVLTLANTASNDEYRSYCLDQGLEVHPARMHPGLPEFFIKLLTTKGDLVLDPFAGSNTTGAVAERLGRRWIGVEQNDEYVDGSLARFGDLITSGA